jgi:hypothetical protein
MGITIIIIFYAVAVTITTIFQFATTTILLFGKFSDRANLLSFCLDFGFLFAFVERYRRLSKGYFFKFRWFSQFTRKFHQILVSLFVY